MPPAIRVNARICHRQLGRGRIVRLYFGNVSADVLFDGEPAAVRVELRDLVPMPAHWPASVDAGATVTV